MYIRNGRWFGMVSPKPSGMMPVPTVCSMGTSPASQQDKPRFQALKHHSMSMTSMKKSALNRPVSRSSRKLNREPDVGTKSTGMTLPSGVTPRRRR